jgi:hypothetical protein
VILPRNRPHRATSPIWSDVYHTCDGSYMCMTESADLCLIDGRWLITRLEGIAVVVRVA